MRWDGRRESENIEDRRGEPGFALREGGGGFPLASLPIGPKAKIFLLIGIVVVALMSGADPLRWLSGDFSMPRAPMQDATAPQANDPAKRFVAVVLADTEDVWTTIFQQNGLTYTLPHLVLFRDAVRSGCGIAAAEMGPFYCPLDQKVYLDLTFFDELQHRLGAPGDFAEAYVVAHEIGHHVQNLLGQFEKAGGGLGGHVSNATQVKLELQADCYAGLWAHATERMQKSLEPGDIEEALNAASAVGDDRLQKRAQGYARPDTFTHGSAAQRQLWFKRGYESGSLKTCDTFGSGV